LLSVMKKNGYPSITHTVNRIVEQHQLQAFAKLSAANEDGSQSPSPLLA
jgi:hypothetical protein